MMNNIKGIGLYYQPSRERKCDRCSRVELPFLIKLRRERFKYEWGYDKYQRVCFSCAKRLQKEKVYEFGEYWKKLWNIKEKKRGAK
jgi:hypothetical protein